MNPATEFENFRTNEWRELNQMHAKYVNDVQILQRDHYAYYPTCDMICRYLDLPAPDWIRRVLNVKYTLLLLALPGVHAAMTNGATREVYNRFCHIIGSKFNRLGVDGPRGEFFVMDNLPLIEIITQMYQPIE